MKQLRIAALAAMLTVGVSGTTLADTDFGTYRHNPMAAIEAGDQLGLQTIPRSELEEVRGEYWDEISYALSILAAVGCNTTACGVVAATGTYLLVKTPYGYRWAASQPITKAGMTTPCAYVNGRYIYC
jgi:hypothetical protein